MTKRIEFTERGIKLPPHIVDDFTRREFLIGAGLIALAPACGSDEGNGGEASGETRTVRDAIGVKSVPADPRRVVTLHEGMLAYLTGLGLGDRVVGTVVGVSGAGSLEEGVAEYIVRALDEPDEIRSLGFYSGDPVDPEAVARLEPDLIVAYQETAEQDGDLFEQIAPIIAPEFSGSHDWAKAARQLATIFGDEASFDDAQQRLERKAAEIGERLGEATQAEVSVISIYSPGTFSVVGADGFEGDLLERVGFRRPPNQDRVAEASMLEIDLSIESIGEWDGDFMLVISSSPGLGEEFLATPVVERLASVRAGRSAIVDAQLWRASNHLGAVEILDQYPEVFAPLR